MVRWLEKNGYNMAYTSDMDTSEDTNPLTNYKAFLVVGHDEYWSKAMRDNVEGAIAAGVNVGFFARQRELLAGADGAELDRRAGPRARWATRTSPTAPARPAPTRSGTSTTRSSRASSAIPQVDRPEEQMMGDMFGGEAFSSDYIVQNASHWVYAGTGWTNGHAIPGIVGYEYDHYFGDANTPAGHDGALELPAREHGERPGRHANGASTRRRAARGCSPRPRSSGAGASTTAAARRWSTPASSGSPEHPRQLQHVVAPPRPTPPGAPTGVAGTARRRRGRAERGRRRPRTAARRSPATAITPSIGGDAPRPRS